MVRRMMHHKESSSDEDEESNEEGPLLTLEEVEALQRETELEKGHQILPARTIQEENEKQDQISEYDENSSSSASEKGDQVILTRRP